MARKLSNGKISDIIMYIVIAIILIILAIGIYSYFYGVPQFSPNAIYTPNYIVNGELSCDNSCVYQYDGNDFI